MNARKDIRDALLVQRMKSLAATRTVSDDQPPNSKVESAEELLVAPEKARGLGRQAWTHRHQCFLM
jgi:hypothetical protein